MGNLRLLGLSGAMTVLLAAFSGAATAQDFPKSTVRFIVAIPPGGVGDVVTRLAAQHLQTVWKVPVIVDNRPGGNAAIAAVAVARAEPDGHTLLVTPDAAFTSNQFLNPNTGFSLADFSPIMLMVRLTPVLAVRSALPIKSFQDLIAQAKAHPGTLSYPSFGVGTYTHLGMEDIKQRTGANILHVPYRGSGSAMADLIGGQHAVILASVSTVEQFVRNGQLRLLATSMPERLPGYPDLPTIAESGLPGFQSSGWFGLFGPAGMAPDLVEKIRADVSAALETPKALEFFRVNAVARENMTAARFAEIIREDARHHGDLIKSAGIKAE